MSPYRTNAQPLGTRWGVTRWVKFWVRHVLPRIAADALQERREWRHYRMELRRYDRELEELLLDPRFPPGAKRRKPLPVAPPSPLKRIFE